MSKKKEWSAANEPDEIKVIAYRNKLLPCCMTKPASKKLVKMSEQSAGCGGGVGEYFYLLLKEAGQVVSEAENSLRCDFDKSKGKIEVRWGFKVKPVREEEGHVLYRIEDDPLGEDGDK